MGSMFSSPSKQANAAAQASQGISQQDISQLENYVSGQQQQLRGAISGLGPNPYFAAGNQMNPANYRINPGDTVGFGSQGPGTQTVLPNNPVQANPYPVPQQPPVNNPQPKPPKAPPPPPAPVGPPAGPPSQPPALPPKQPPIISPGPHLRDGGVGAPGVPSVPNPVRTIQPKPRLQ